MKYYTCKYQWRISSEEDKVYYKLLTDVVDGHRVFVQSLQKEFKDLKTLVVEYLSEVDCEKYQRPDVLYDINKDNDVVEKNVSVYLEGGNYENI